jgi:peptidoglycan/LPS O-acetylase OafA/YrhL
VVPGRDRGDLDDHWGTGWVGLVLDYGVPVVGIVVIAGLAMALHRSMGVRPRHWPRPFLRGTVWLGVAFLVIFIGLGTVLRLADVGWDSTISALAAALVFLGGSLALRRARGTED